MVPRFFETFLVSLRTAPWPQAMPTTGLLPGADAAHAHAPLAPTSGLDDIIRALSQGSMNRGGWGPQAADQYGYAPPAMFGGPAPMMRGGGQIAPMQPTYQQQVAVSDSDAGSHVPSRECFVVVNAMQWAMAATTGRRVLVSHMRQH